MRKRFTWIVAVLALVSIGFVMACSTKYSSHSNGLVVVPTQASAVMQTFSLDLSNGRSSQINNVNGPPTPGLPTSVVLDPSGTHAYVITYQNAALNPSSTGIAIFPVGSDGKLGAATTTSLNGTLITVGVTCQSVPVTPVAMAIDSSGKFLFVANSGNGSTPGSVSVLAISSTGFNEVNPVSCAAPSTPGSPYPLPAVQGGATPSASALAVTPTVFPSQFAACAVAAPPATENLYVADSSNNLLYNYQITSSGSLSLVLTGVNPVTTGTLPSGVAVDPCDRFAYVANTNSNTVSAYTICNTISPSCTAADDSLQQVTGSPYTTGDLPGPIAADPFGNFVYVVDTGGSQISAFRVGSATGALTSIQTIATNAGSNSIAIRSDGNWLFVANSTAANVSQYAITPATGNLTLVTAIPTLNLPSGVAVK